MPTLQRPGRRLRATRSLTLTLGLLLSLSTSALAQPQPQPQPGDDAAADAADDDALRAELEGLLWLDRSSGLLASGATAVAVVPDRPEVIYAGGSGFVLRSLDAGLSWQPVLLLSSAQLTDEPADGDEPLFLRVEEQDLEALEDAEVLERFETLRDEALDELTELYGEDLAEEIIQDLEDELRREAEQDVEGAFGDELDPLLEPDTLVDEPDAAPDDGDEALDEPLIVHELLVPHDAPETVYAATGRGLFRSTDLGRTWQRLLGGFTGEENVLDVAVAPGGQRILAGTVSGLVVSVDAGRTWTPPLGILSSETVRHLAGGLNDATVFLAVSDAELQRTEDGGLTWRSLVPTEFDPDEINELLAVVGWSDTLFVATDRGVFRSDDGGTTWNDLSPGLPERDLLDLVLPDPSNPQLLLALSARRVFASLDGGTTWLDVSSGLLGQRIVAGASGGSIASLWLATDTGMVRGMLGVEAAVAAETARQLRALWASEPSPARTIAAALIHAGLEDIPTDAWNARRFSAHFLPRVFGEVSHRVTRLDREFVDFETPTLVADPGLDALTLQRRVAQPRTLFDWQVLAVWDLGELLYDSDELAIERASRSLHQARMSLVSRLVRVFMTRRALQLRVAAEGSTELRRRLEATLQLEESTALLDGLTGGFFTAATASSRAAHNPAP